MKAVTTPAPLLVLKRACTFPYHIYIVLARSVPTVSGAMVNSTSVPYWMGDPLETQSALVASPRYLVFGWMPSKFSNVYVLLWQTGSGVHEFSENDDRGSQPPKQYAPTPHWPYSVTDLSVHRNLQFEFEDFPLTRATRRILRTFATQTTILTQGR